MTVSWGKREIISSAENSSFSLALSHQVLKAAPVSGILMTALTTGVRTEGFVWMGSIPTTAAAPLSGQVRTVWWIGQAGARIGNQRQAVIEVSAFHQGLCVRSLCWPPTFSCVHLKKCVHRYLTGHGSELGTMLPAEAAVREEHYWRTRRLSGKSSTLPGT